MDEPAQGIGRDEAQEPEDKQDNSNGGKHVLYFIELTLG